MSLRQQKIDAILKKYGNMVTGLNDLTAGDPPSALFYILADKLSYLLDADPKIAISPKGIKRRRRINPIIKALGAHFLNNPQVFENRNFLCNPSCTAPAPDKSIVLPDEPVIWASNHGFKDDALASALAAQRHAYILFGSLPQFYNTVDGVTAWLIGVVMANRKISASKKAAIPKAVQAMNYGADLLIYPEGTWNISQNVLVLDLWPGIYRIACETGAKIVPIVHYLCENDKSKSNVIHTVIDDPVRIDNLGEQQALKYTRDIFATWYYLMIEAYGKSTHDEILGKSASPADAWQQQLEARLSFVDRWDNEIEQKADYRPKWKVSPQQVWQAVADVTKITPQNVRHILYARELVAQCAREDFQHRF